MCVYVRLVRYFTSFVFWVNTLKQDFLDRQNQWNDKFPITQITQLIDNTHSSTPKYDIIY